MFDIQFFNLEIFLLCEIPRSRDFSPIYETITETSIVLAVVIKCRNFEISRFQNIVSKSKNNRITSIFYIYTLFNKRVWEYILILIIFSFNLLPQIYRKPLRLVPWNTNQVHLFMRKWANIRKSLRYLFHEKEYVKKLLIYFMEKSGSLHLWVLLSANLEKKIRDF